MQMRNQAWVCLERMDGARPATQWNNKTRVKAQISTKIKKGITFPDQPPKEMDDTLLVFMLARNSAEEMEHEAQWSNLFFSSTKHFSARLKRGHPDKFTSLIIYKPGPKVPTKTLDHPACRELVAVRH